MIAIEKCLLDEIEKKLNVNLGCVNIAANELLTIIEELLKTIDSLQEDIESLEEDIKENYRPVSVAEQVAISDNDFI